ncbi:unnamed protein product [Taenia asiatica]|uniref:RNA helicase n=1 Tax=Taenia asiatica TaxID=60517 RepID=A0A0R3VUW4_TAEAS|nr:unnamed protein product [Taenia asiatica]
MYFNPKGTPRSRLQVQACRLRRHECTPLVGYPSIMLPLLEFLLGCKLLACLMESNLELLYVRNNMGTSPSSLLEQLWLLASSEERTKGDAVGKGGDDVCDGGSEERGEEEDGRGEEEVALRHRKASLFNLSPLCLPALHSSLSSARARVHTHILMQCSLQGDLFGKIRPPKRRCNDTILEDAWQERLVDELNADFPCHEEYFQGNLWASFGRFTDAESNSAKKTPFMIYCGISQLLTSVSHAEGEASANRMPLYVCTHTYALDLTLPLSRLRSWKYSASTTGRFFRSPVLESTPSISRIQVRILPLGFTDADASSGDFFEDIRKEYERKKSRCMHRPQPESNQPSASNTHVTASTRDEEFRRRHAAALRNRGLASPVSNLGVTVLSYEQYSEQWQTFLRSGTNRDIPWPPVKVGDTEELLRFVGRSLLHLRQLQVDWHPDRFFARLPSHVQRTEELANRVTALSQFFNKAVVELRSYVEKLKQ